MRWLLLLVLLIALVFWVMKEPHLSGNCPFCDQAVLKRQQFYQNQDVFGLYDHHPLAQGHVLIVPRRHVTRFEELSKREILAVSDLIKSIFCAEQKALNVKDYLIVQKNGLLQSVSHVHFHFVPKRADEPEWLFALKAIVKSALPKNMWIFPEFSLLIPCKVD